jgi:hypothetical protein
MLILKVNLTRVYLIERIYLMNEKPKMVKKKLDDSVIEKIKMNQLATTKFLMAQKDQRQVSSANLRKPFTL